MKISWKWLAEYVDLSGLDGPEALAEILTARGLEVEAVERLDRGFDRVISAQILERNRHPDADKLSLCVVSTGSAEPLQIVCGAQNMKAGDKVALAQVGANLPNGIKIEKSKIRGVESFGMLCSEEELKLKEEAEGILILPPSTELGKPLAQVLGLDDTILTFKLTANRSDCLSHYGMAREVAAALGKKPHRPEVKIIERNEGNSPIRVQLEAGESGPQFFGVYLRGVKARESSPDVVRKLERLGLRSINSIVDATNLVMLEMGHPVHAYDAKKIEGALIRVRMANAGEELNLLDDSKVKLDGSELVIADAHRAIGLAGVMGGGNSEVQDSTTEVFLECAEFAPGLVRKASSKFAKKTDAAHRFERGIDPAGLPYVMGRLVQLVQAGSGGEVVGCVVMQSPKRQEVSTQGKKISLSPKFFEEFLGMDVTPVDAKRVLERVDCTVVEKTSSEWEVTAPSYRLDLHLPEDLSEEVARSLGYDRIPATIPMLSSAPRPAAQEPETQTFLQMDRAKDALARLGLCETLNFAFTSKTWLSEFGLASSARLQNPLSEDLQELVPSLVPGLVKNAMDNTRHHFGSEPLSIRLFELRPTFGAKGPVQAANESSTGVEETWKLAFALSGPRLSGGLRAEQDEINFFDAKAVLDRFFETMGTRGIRTRPIGTPEKPAPQGYPYSLLHEGKSIEVWAGNGMAGFLGQLHPALEKKWKLRSPLWICELDWTAIQKLSLTGAKTFQAWPEQPPMERDFALVVGEQITAEKIVQVAQKAGKPLAKVVKVFDVYRGPQVGEGKVSTAVRVIFYGEGRALVESETEQASQKIINAWKSEIGAELR